MGDSSPRDRAIAAENSLGSGKKINVFFPGAHYVKCSQVANSMSTEWTDEKHKSYLNSIEASFVEQLYSSERCSNDLLELSASDLKNQSFNRFKVQRRGCWENHKFERANGHAENDSESLRLCQSPWIQHFRTRCTDKGPLLASAHETDNSKVVSQSVHLTIRRHASEVTSSKQLPSFCSQKVHKVSIGSITEVSDQNFVDVKDGRGEELNRRNRKKRMRSLVSPIADQVVPFVTSDEKAASNKENNQ